MLVATTAFADDKRLTLADLETLVSDGAYQEALQHAGDIAPAQRTAKWTELTATASAGVLATVSTDDGAALFMIDAIDKQYPQLQKSAKYMKVRGELGVKSLAGCWDNSDECGKLATRLVAGDTKLAADVGKIAVRYDKAVAVACFKTAGVCKGEAVTEALIGGLEQAPDSATAAAARSMMTSCWSDVKDAVVKAFDNAGKNGNIYKNACSTLAAKHMLSSLQAKRCK